MTKETENQIYLRRAKEALVICQEAEDQARRNLAAAVDATQRMRAKVHDLFIAEERAEMKRHRLTKLEY